MGETAENLAKQRSIPRARQEAVRGRVAAARPPRRSPPDSYADEIVPIVWKGGTVTKDGCSAPETTLEGLAGLKLAFDAEGHGHRRHLLAGHRRRRRHAGLLGGLRARARAGSRSRASRASRSPAARPRSWASARWPRPARRSQRAGLTVADIDLFELNEAFASQSLACIDELGLDPAKVNLDGGAIALGHPLGATGARITGKAAALLAREGKRYAVATQCIGGGQGIATVLEAV